MNEGRIKETFIFKIGGKKIEVINAGTKKFKNMNDPKQALKDLKSMIQDDLRKGKETGFYPYNNFESSINWKLKN